MSTVREVKENVGLYLEQTSSGRQTGVRYFSVFVLALFIAFLYGMSTTAEEISVKGGQKSDIVSEASLSSVQNSSFCTLPKVFPSSEYQSSWEKVLSFCDSIEWVSREQGLEPELIASLIMLESGGEPSAISQSGAIGLMQIMSSDGLSGQLYGSYFSSRPTVVELLDPDYNIEWGTSYLANLVSIYGDLKEALFHYGPANVGYEGYADKVLNVYKSISD